MPLLNFSQFPHMQVTSRIAHWIIWCSYGISVAAVLLLSFAHASDKLQSRGIFMGIASTISGIGYVYLCCNFDTLHISSNLNLTGFY
jgi:hypothetical protein